MIKGRIDEAIELGRQWPLREESAVERGGKVVVEKPKSWRPSQSEREAIARWIVAGASAEDVAEKLSKTVEQVKNCLRHESTQEALASESDFARQQVGFTLSGLYLELPKLMNNMLAMAHDSVHPKHFDANKYCLDTALKPQLSDAQEKIQLHVELAPQLTTMIQIATEGYLSEREQNPRESIKEIAHLRKGKDGVISKKVGGVKVARGEEVTTLDVDAVVDPDDG